ncbi:MAG: hypothetical protein QOH32_3145 [Bradyrhizobium sp.]|jgi:hypothetical protein|nr:hypothetical protein [Bradyrhizobium sp.]
MTEARWPTRHRIIDIAPLPEYRGRGVEKHNPAMRLHRRPGFVTGEDKGVHDLMRWIPQLLARGDVR